MCYDDVMEYMLIECGSKTLAVDIGCDLLVLNILIAKSLNLEDINNSYFADDKRLDMNSRVADLATNFDYYNDSYKISCHKLDKLEIDEDPASCFVAYEIVEDELRGYDSYEVMDVVREYEGLSDYADEESLRAMVADLVFNDEWINELYCDLANAIGINDAYEKIVTIYEECMVLDLTEDDFDREFTERLNELKIFSENIV